MDPDLQIVDRFKSRRLFLASVRAIRGDQDHSKFSNWCHGCRDPLLPPCRGTFAVAFASTRSARAMAIGEGRCESSEHVTEEREARTSVVPWLRGYSLKSLPRRHRSTEARFSLPTCCVLGNLSTGLPWTLVARDASSRQTARQLSSTREEEEQRVKPSHFARASSSDALHGAIVST